MSTDDRQSFLADVRIGVLGVTDPRDRRAPLQVPVWYSYQPDGDVVVLTARDSVKARFIRRAGRFSICVQCESPPYRYVSVEGPVVAVDDPLRPDVREAMAHRYLDSTTARAYLDANRHQLIDDLAFYMRPTHWRTADFSAFAKKFSEV